MKRLLIALLILFIIVPATVVLAAVTYSADITVSNNGTTSYAQIGVTASENVSLLVSNGFITSTGLDARVRQSSSDLPYMLATDRVTFSVPSLINTSNVYQFVTGQTAASSFQIVPGYGGYVTTNDTAASELGSGTWSIPHSAYIDTSVDGTVFSKAGAYSEIITSGNVTFLVNNTTSNTTPTSAAGTGWANPNNSFDGNTATYASISVAKLTTSANITVNMTASDYLSSINVWPDRSGANPEITTMTVYLYYNGTWNSIYSGAPSWGAWNTISLTNVQYSNSVAFTFTCGNGAGVNAEARLNEVTFGIASRATVATSTGDKVIIPQSDGTNMWITAGSSASANTTAKSVPDTANPIVWSSNVTYFDYMKIVVAGVEKLWYQPVTIINGTNLPDRDGTKDGDITWGSNPSGLTTSFGALISTTIISTNVTSSGYVGNFMPSEVHNDTSKTLAQAEAAVESDILYAFIKPFADTSGTQAVWFYWFGTILIAVLGFIFAYKTKHLLIAAIAWDIPFGYGIAKGYIPWWVIIILALWTIGAAIQEARM